MTENSSKHPNPGSDEAIALGCRCPVWDNGHGKGYLGQEGVFVMSSACSLHGDAVRNLIEEWVG